MLLTYRTLAETAEFPQGNNKLVEIYVFVTILVKGPEYSFSEVCALEIKQSKPLNNIDAANLLRINFIEYFVQLFDLSTLQLHAAEHFDPFFRNLVTVN